MRFDKPITLQKLDEGTEQWSDFLPRPIHARVNKSNGSEYLSAGASRASATRVFEIRYFKQLEDINNFIHNFINNLT